MRYFNETYIKRQFITRNEWADTYKAIDSITDEKVILKVLVRKSQDNKYINNLLKEVQVLKTIKNPNIVNMHNMLKYSGCGKIYYYIECEYFKGISLAEKLVNKKFKEYEAIKMVEKLSYGLKELHDKNILFDNLNLNNIFINSKDVIKVDILSYLENKDFEYVPNEDEETKVKEVKFNPQKDIYDLGVVLYSLLTGKLSFEDNNYKKQIFNENLVSIIEKATNSHLENKYINIDRFILDLKSYLQYGQLSNETYNVEEILPINNKIKKGNVGKKLGVCASIVMAGWAIIYGYDLLEKNKKNIETNTTKIEQITEIEDTSGYKEDKVIISNKKDNKSSEKNSSTSDSNKGTILNSDLNDNNSNSNSLNNNHSNSSSSNHSSNNNNSDNNISKPSKPNKPNNIQGSEGTITNQNEENNDVDQTPEVIPPSNENVEDEVESENITPQSPNLEVDSK